jgi:energy-coupling factor transport system ATP-binding protein
MIRFDGVSVTYGDAPRPTLHHLDLAIPEGELALVIGPTGSGKSTLLGTVNGMVPRFTGGTLAGRVLVDGRDTAGHSTREMADLVGVVPQDPAAAFVTDVVEEELAYGMEQLGIPPEVMRRRVEETLDLLGIAHLRHRAVATLSGGEQQRVAIGAVLTSHPRVVVLDEPTSALDPTASEEVLAAVTRLVHDLALTVLMAEHRLERVVQYADLVVGLDGSGSATAGPAAAVLAASPIAPPVVMLGRLAGWDPVPLSIRQARRHAGDLRRRLDGALPERRLPASGPPVLVARGVVVTHGTTTAVRSVDLEVGEGEVVALMGRNGSGKTSLLWALQGSGRRTAGTVAVDGSDPGGAGPAEARRLVALVPHDPADLLYADSVDEECAAGDAESGADPGTCRSKLERILPGIPGDRHPGDLSEGQRLALVLAVQLAASPRVLLLDEPTRGLDYAAKEQLTGVLRAVAAGGRAVVVATHDVEFAAAAATRVVVMAQGEVVTDGPASSALVASPAFSPQVARVMRPDPWLTVEEVAAALGGAPE